MKPAPYLTPPHIYIQIKSNDVVAELCFAPFSPVSASCGSHTWCWWPPRAARRRTGGGAGLLWVAPLPVAVAAAAAGEEDGPGQVVEGANLPVGYMDDMATVAKTMFNRYVRRAQGHINAQ